MTSNDTLNSVFVPILIIGRPLFSTLLCLLYSSKMATIPFNVCASDVSDPPPSYDAVYTSVSTDFIQSTSKGSVFSFLQTKQKHRRASVLSRINAIVSSPDLTPSSITPIVRSCAAALPASEFSSLLQKPNIENHTALYWAIVNKRQEALSEFIKFIPKILPASYSDLRLACMTVNDHNSFMLLNLGENVNCKYRYTMF